MKSTDGIVCRECRGLNQPGSRFCWYCGVKLPRMGRGPGGRLTALGVALQVLKWVLAVAALAVVVAGLYYAVDRFMLPLFQKDETPTTTLVARTTTSTTRPTTTTTTIPRTDRVVAAGADRYATAIAISELGFPEGAPGLVLVPGDDFAKAMTVTPLAAAYGGPVLLLPPEGVRDDLAAEIERLDPGRVFLVGVPKPKTVTGQLQEILGEPEVTRLTGDDAYQIAALVAEEVKAKRGTVTKVVIVPSDSFIEAIAVAPLAAVKGWPILLVTETDELPSATKNALKALEVDSALVVGTDVELTLGDVERQMGADGYATAALVVEYAAAQGLHFTHTAIATGDGFPDGLVTGSYLAQDNGILLLARGGRLPSLMLSMLTDNLKSVRTLDFIALPVLAEELAGPGAGGTAGTTTTEGTNTSTTEGN